MTARTIKLPVLVSVQRLDYQLVVSVNLREVSVGEWCVNLCLLKEGLVSSLRIVGDKKLEFIIDKSLKRAERARLNYSSQAVEVLIHPDEFDYLVSFFLKYYRDGVAEVDSLDIEALATSEVTGEVEEVYLTFHVRDAAPPLSPEAVRKLLAEDE